MEEISNAKLTLLFKEILDEYQARIGEVVEVDKKTRDAVLDIVLKINNLPKKTWTSIAELTNYDSETVNINPLEQGTIANYVGRLCKKMGIELIYQDSFGGLAYMRKFQKS